MLAVLGLVAVAAIVFVAPLLGFLGGAFSGWVVGVTFPNTMADLIAALHLTVAPWQLGGILGFIGGFFKSYSTGSK